MHASISETLSMYQDLKEHFLNVTQSISRAWMLLLTACTLLAGCNSEEPIRIYNAPKEPNLASSAPSGPGEPQELLGVLIAGEGRPWAFKMVGAPEKVSQFKDDFRELINSFSVGSDGQPTWKLPEAWREEAGNEFVYRAFRPTSDTSMRATVSELAYSFNPADLDAAKWQEYVLQNVNRWRGSLKLNDQAWDEMSSDLETIDKLTLRDLPAYYVTLRGEASGKMGGPMSGGPMSGGQWTRWTNGW